MKTFLINLDRSPERLAFMTAQFERLGIPFERFAAVNGEDLAQDEIEAFARARPAVPDWVWSPGSIGVFLSQTAIWKRIVSEDLAMAAIFEDDAHLASDIKTLLQSDVWMPPDADVVRLEGMGRMKLTGGRRIPLCRGRRLYRSVSGTWGAAGYILRRAAAAALLAAPESEHIPVDHLMFSPGVSPVAKRFRCYQVVPSVCIQDQLLGDKALGLGSITTPGRPPDQYRRKRWSPLSLVRPYSKMLVEFRP